MCYPLNQGKSPLFLQSCCEQRICGTVVTRLFLAGINPIIRAIAGIVQRPADSTTAIKEQGGQDQYPGRDEESNEEDFAVHNKSVP